MKDRLREVPHPRAAEPIAAPESDLGRGFLLGLLLGSAVVLFALVVLILTGGIL